MMERKIMKIAGVIPDRDAAVLDIVFDDGCRASLPCTCDETIDWLLSRMQEGISPVDAALELDKFAVSVEVDQDIIKRVVRKSRTAPSNLLAESVEVRKGGIVPSQSAPAPRTCAQGRGPQDRLSSTQSAGISSLLKDTASRYERIWRILQSAEEQAEVYIRYIKARTSLEKALEIDTHLRRSWEEYEAWVAIYESQYPDGITAVASQHVDRLGAEISEQFPGSLDAPIAEPVYPDLIYLSWWRPKLREFSEILLPIPISTWESIRCGEAGTEETLAMQLVWAMSKWKSVSNLCCTFTTSSGFVCMRIHCREGSIVELPSPTFNTAIPGLVIPVEIVPIVECAKRSQT